MDLIPLDAEQALLGAWMTDREAWDLTADLYVPGMFGGPAHNVIAEAAVRMLEAGKTADPIMVAAEVPEVEGEERPLSYVLGLARNIGSAAGVRYYAERVREAWAVRRARGILAEALNAEGMKAAPLIESVTRALSAVEVGDTGAIRTMQEDALAFLEELEAERQRRPGTEIRSTGFEMVDQITGGLETGLPHLIAARPAGGKSSYAVAMASYSAGALKEPTALIWIEDTRRKAMLRFAAREAGVPATLLRHGSTLDTDKFDRVARAMDRVSKWPLYIESAKGLTPQQIAARMRRLRREKGVQRFLCDHLGEMNLGHDDRQVTQKLGDAMRVYRDTLEAVGGGGAIFHQLNQAGTLYNSDQLYQVARVVGYINEAKGATMTVEFVKCTYGPPGSVVKLGWEPLTMSVFNPKPPETR